MNGGDDDDDNDADDDNDDDNNDDDDDDDDNDDEGCWWWVQLHRIYSRGAAASFALAASGSDDHHPDDEEEDDKEDDHHPDDEEEDDLGIFGTSEVPPKFGLRSKRFGGIICTKTWNISNLLQILIILKFTLCTLSSTYIALIIYSTKITIIFNSCIKNTFTEWNFTPVGIILD